MTMDSRAGTIAMPPGRCAPPQRRVIVELTGRGSGGVPTLPALVETARSQRPGAQAEPGWRGLGRHVRFGFLLRYSSALEWENVEGSLELDLELATHDLVPAGKRPGRQPW